MITDEIYNKVVEAVESEITLPPNWILESKTEDATDARYILCDCLRKQGLSSAQIQFLTGLKKSTVNIMLAGIMDRVGRRKVTHIWWLQIGRRLEIVFG